MTARADIYIAEGKAERAVLREAHAIAKQLEKGAFAKVDRFLPLFKAVLELRGVPKAQRAKLERGFFARQRAEQAVVRAAHALARSLARGAQGEILDPLLAAVEEHRVARRKGTTTMRGRS